MHLPTRSHTSRLLFSCFIAVMSIFSADLWAVEMPLPEDIFPELRPILEAALAQSPTMLLQNLSIAQAKAAKMAADSVYYPHIGASASDGVTKSAVTDPKLGKGPTSSSKGLFYGASANMPLFQWGAIRAGTDIAAIQVKVVQKQYAEAYRSLAIAVRSQYLALIAYRGNVHLSELNLKRAETQLSLAQERLDEGQISGGEMVAPRLAVEDARLGVEQTQVNFDHSLQLFMNLSGIKAFSIENLPADIPRLTYVPEIPRRLVQTFLQGGPEKSYLGQIYLHQIQQARLSYHRARVANLPTFGLGAGGGLSNASSVTPATTDAASGRIIPGTVSQAATQSINYGINVGWNIFDGFATQANTRSALISQRQAERNLKTYVESTIEQAGYAEKLVKIAAGAMNLSTTRSSLAESMVKQVSDDVQYGSAPQAALDDVKLNSLSAKQTALAARIEFLNRWTEFVSAVSADPILNNVPYEYLNRDAK